MRPLLWIKKHFGDALNCQELYMWLDFCLVWSDWELFGFSTDSAWKAFLKAHAEVLSCPEIDLEKGTRTEHSHKSVRLANNHI